MDTRIISRDTLEMLEILRKQRENMTPRKAKKLLKELGIWDRLVPIEEEKKKGRSAGKKK